MIILIMMFLTLHSPVLPAAGRCWRWKQLPCPQSCPQPKDHQIVGPTLLGSFVDTAKSVAVFIEIGAHHPHQPIITTTTKVVANGNSNGSLPPHHQGSSHLPEPPQPPKPQVDQLQPVPIDDLIAANKLFKNWDDDDEDEELSSSSTHFRNFYLWCFSIFIF